MQAAERAERAIVESRPAVALAMGITFAGLGLHLLLFLALPMARKISLVPDDGFYYLNLARNYARTGQWTFDGGVSTTTGFHLLHAYVCAAFFRLLPEASPAFCVAFQATLATALTAAAASLTVRALAPIVRPASLLACPAVFLAGGALSCTAMAMEWPYVVLFAALGLYALARGRAGVALVAGLLGVLSRSDFAGFGICVLAVALVPLRPALPATVRRACAAFVAGALAGLAIVALHTFAVSGQFVQASVRVKQHWGHLAGYNVLPALDGTTIATPLGYLMLRLFHWGPLTFVLVAAPALALVVARALRDDHALRRDLAIGSVATLLAYAAVYGFNSDAAQPWYSANAIVPLVSVHALLLDALSGRALRSAIGAIAVLVLTSVATARKPNWVGQVLTWRAALALERSPPPGRLASWNAGILAVFSGRPVVNIDGLMNDDVYRDVVGGTLRCYVLREDIGFIVDSPVMFAPRQAARGGYGDGLLRSAARERVLVEDGGSRRSLFEIDRGALAAQLPPCPPSPKAR